MGLELRRKPVRVIVVIADARGTVLVHARVRRVVVHLQAIAVLVVESPEPDRTRFAQRSLRIEIVVGLDPVGPFPELGIRTRVIDRSARRAGTAAGIGRVAISPFLVGVAEYVFVGSPWRPANPSAETLVAL